MEVFMHSKQKGNIAQSLVVLELQKNGFNVFSEIGDYSKIDIIAEKNGQLTRIQVKYNKVINGACRLHLIKSGPNGYRYTYQKEDCDWFVLYNPQTDDLYWIDSAEACRCINVFTIRTDFPKNNQIQNVKLAKDYTIERFLRNFPTDIASNPTSTRESKTLNS